MKNAKISRTSGCRERDEIAECMEEAAGYIGISRVYRENGRSNRQRYHRSYMIAARRADAVRIAAAPGEIATEYVGCSGEKWFSLGRRCRIPGPHASPSSPGPSSSSSPAAFFRAATAATAVRSGVGDGKRRGGVTRQNIAACFTAKCPCHVGMTRPLTKQRTRVIRAANETLRNNFTFITL